MTSDLDLLGQFARGKSQDAFTALVNRHVNLVHSAALRQVRSPQLAEEVSQSVFADLARVAATPSSPKILTPWLYAVTRRTAIDVVRKESRRQLREQIAVEMTNMNATANDWAQIEPLLDDAMAALDETDRSAILLRYFENKSLREVGEALGTNDDAAQKRVSRAVERLREFFTKRNVTIGAGGLAILISTNAVQAAPVGLAAAISAAAVLAGTAVHTSTIIAATKSITMTTLQKTVITAALTAAIGTGIYEAHQAVQLREQNLTLHEQQAPLAGQIQQLQRERDDAMNRLGSMAEEIAKTKNSSNELELLRLRGEVARLRMASQTLAETKHNSQPDKTYSFKLLGPLLMLSDSNGQKSITHLDEISANMKKQLEPRVSNAVASLNATLNFTLEQEQKIRDILLQPTTLASGSNELRAVYGVDLLQMSLLPKAMEMGQMNGGISTEQAEENRGAIARAEEQIKELLTPDQQSGYEHYKRDYIGASVPPEATMLLPIVKAYEDANFGQEPKSPSDLLPFVTTPEQQTALQKLEQAGRFAPK